MKMPIYFLCQHTGGGFSGGGGDAVMVVLISNDNILHFKLIISYPHEYNYYYYTIKILKCFEICSTYIQVQNREINKYTFYIQ